MKTFRTASVALSVFTLLLGIAYPLAITGLANLLFRDQATGSLVERDGKIVGSRLVGQEFKGEGFFHGRPSSSGYKMGTSSNIALSNPLMGEKISLELARLGWKDMRNIEIPVEMLLESASGLDPDISLESALFQAESVSRARGLDPERVRGLVGSMAKRGIGYSFVNVLELNLKILEMNP